MRFIQKTLISNQDSSTTYNSDPVDASYLYSASLIINTDTTGTVGSVTLDVSDDAPNTTPTHWYSLATVATNGSGNYIIPYKELSYQWVRASFTMPFVQPTDTITTVADVAGSLRSKAFLLQGSGGILAMFFLVDGTGSNPVAGHTGIGSLISSGASANDVATALVAAINGLAGVHATAVNNVVTVTHFTSMSTFVPASDYNSGFSFSSNIITGTVSVNFKGSGA
jgi:hypothetical protein